MTYPTNCPHCSHTAAYADGTCAKCGLAVTAVPAPKTATAEEVREAFQSAFSGPAGMCSKCSTYVPSTAGWTIKGNATAASAGPSCRSCWSNQREGCSE